MTDAFRYIKVGRQMKKKKIATTYLIYCCVWNVRVM